MAENMMYYLDKQRLVELWRKIWDYFVPKTRNINGHTLDEDISLSYQDVNAIAMDTVTVDISSAKWSNNTVTVDVPEVGNGDTVIVCPNSASHVNWGKWNVRCSSQGAGTLSFTSASTVTTDLKANVLILRTHPLDNAVGGGGEEET